MTEIKAFLAGCVIGLGGIVYLAIPQPIIGSLLFSFGLLTIIAKGYNLYTGMIGYYKIKDTSRYLKILFFNFLGAILMGKIALLLNYNATDLVITKMSKDYIALFFSSILCGIFMYLGVSMAKDKNNPLYAILAVMLFILTGSEHCIANAFYFSAITSFNFKFILFFIINILGNSIGSIIWYKLEHIKNSIK